MTTSDMTVPPAALPRKGATFAQFPTALRFALRKQTSGEEAVSAVGNEEHPVVHEVDRATRHVRSKRNLLPQPGGNRARRRAGEHHDIRRLLQVGPVSVQRLSAHTVARAQRVGARCGSRRRTKRRHRRVATAHRRLCPRQLRSLGPDLRQRSGACRPAFAACRGDQRLQHRGHGAVLPHSACRAGPPRSERAARRSRTTRSAE